MENLIKDFLNYLFDMGIVDVDSAKDFLNIYHETKFPHYKYSLEFNDIEDSNSREHLAQESLTKALFIFLSRSSESEKNFISRNIFKKFCINKSVDINKKARSLFVIYSQKLRKNSKIELHKKIQKWKKLSQVSSANMSYLLNSRSYLLETSSMRKENEQLKQCTFQPKINTSNPQYLSNNANLSSSKLNSPPAYERLYSEHEKSKRRKMLKEIEQDKKESKMASFSPDMSLNSNKTYSYVNKTNFHDRQNNFSKSKGKNRERIVKEIEKEMNCKYTFSPKILKNSKYLSNKLNQTDKYNEVNFMSNSNSRTNSKSNYVINSNFENTPAYVRLYEENARRKNFNFMKKSDENFSNISAEKKNLSHSRDSKNYSIHNHTLKNLYEDHKRNQINKKRLEKDFDEEQGLTFKPKFISNNEKYTSKYNFDDRNKKLLEDKQKIIEIFNQINEEKFINEQLTRKVSPSHYEEIQKGIVSRLYNKGLEKMLKRNFEPEISEREKISPKPHIGMNIQQYLHQLNEKLQNEENKSDPNLFQENQQEFRSDTVNNNEDFISKADGVIYNKDKNETNMKKGEHNFPLDSKLKKNEIKSEKNSYREDLNHSSSKKPPRYDTNSLTTAPNKNTVNNISEKNNFISINEYTFGKGKKVTENDKKLEYNFNEDFNLDDDVDTQRIAKDLKFEQGDNLMKEQNEAVDNNINRGFNKDVPFRSNSMKMIYMNEKAIKQINI